MVFHGQNSSFDASSRGRNKNFIAFFDAAILSAEIVSTYLCLNLAVDKYMKIIIKKLIFTDKSNTAAGSSVLNRGSYCSADLVVCIIGSSIDREVIYLYEKTIFAIRFVRSLFCIF